MSCACEVAFTFSVSLLCFLVARKEVFHNKKYACLLFCLSSWFLLVSALRLSGRKVVLQKTESTRITCASQRGI